MDDGNFRRFGEEYCYYAKAYIVNTEIPDGTVPPAGTGIFAVRKETLTLYLGRAERSALGQFFELVLKRMETVEHVFRGLERPLYTDQNKEADATKLVYSFRCEHDFEWVGGAFDGRIEAFPSPAQAVYYVIVTPNAQEEHVRKYPEINGWIERWGWVEADAVLAGAPKQWVDRYSEKLWSREKRNDNDEW